MAEILVPVVALGFLGLVFGVGLAIAAKRLAVHTDPRLEKVHGLLPGANCGACGGAGCFGFAEMLISGKAPLSACKVAEDRARELIAGVLGMKAETRLKQVATLHCAGGTKVKDRFDYRGIKDCVAANLVMGGQKGCVFGCLGFGTCELVCPFGAIKMSGEGLPVVDKDKCKACNKCVEACPKQLFTLVDLTQNVYVACRSRDTGKDTRAVCVVGCIACRKCEQVCPSDAIHVMDNLAVIDYSKCTSCAECVKVCPAKTIKVRV